MTCKFNSIEYYLRITPYLFLKANQTQNKPHSVYFLVIIFDVTELSLHRGKLKAHRMRPKLFIKLDHFLENLLKVKSLTPIL